MWIHEIVARHTPGYAIIWPKMRDAETKRVLSWTVLQTCRQVKKLKGLLEYYRLEGFDGVTVLPCFDENDKRAEEFPPELCAHFFRSYLGVG